MSVHVSRLPMTVDPLIEEANRRKRRRRLLAGALTAMVLAAALTFVLRPRGPENPRAGGPTPSGAAETSRAEAGRSAESLLRTIPLPPGARRVSDRTASAAAGNPNYGTNIFTQYEYRHAFWQVPEPLVSVIAFLRQHPPPDFAVGGVGYGETNPYEGVLFNGGSVGGRIPSRVLASVVSSPGGTIVRVDAGVPWTVPRSPSEVVPAAVHEVDIQSTVGSQQSSLRRAGAKDVSLRVTDSREIGRIVRWFNDLNIVQPNTAVLGCAFVMSAPVQFTFRSASGAEVASAIVPSTSASSCYSIQFTLNGQRQPPLIDSTPENGMSFIDRVQRLLGLRFGPRDGRF